MIVYVESNFVLELALVQEQAPAADAILTLAEQPRFSLVCPAFAFSEPFAAIMRLEHQRRQAHTAMQQQVRELARSGMYQQVAAQWQPLVTVLVHVEEDQIAALTDTLDRVLGASASPALDQRPLRQSIQYRDIYNLRPQDALIYASILADLRGRDLAEPKCFISRDVRGFERAAIKRELRQYNCRFIGDFVNGLSYIQSVLEGQKES